MTPYQKRPNKYIQRMADDMKLRNFAQSTIDAYTWHVDKFCQYFGKQAEQLGPEQIRASQLYLVKEKKASWSSFNQAVGGLRFLYQVTLGRSWTVKHIPFGKRPKKIPAVLGDEEVQRLLGCVPNLKHRTVLADRTIMCRSKTLSSPSLSGRHRSRTSCPKLPILPPIVAWHRP